MDGEQAGMSKEMTAIYEKIRRRSDQCPDSEEA